MQKTDGRHPATAGERGLTRRDHPRHKRCSPHDGRLPLLSPRARRSRPGRLSLRVYRAGDRALKVRSRLAGFPFHVEFTRFAV